MPIIKSASKRMRQADKKRDQNRLFKKQLRAVVKEFTTKPTAETFKAAQGKIDRAVKRGVLKLNTASRKKAKLAKVAKAAGVKIVATAKPAVKKTETKKAPTKKTETKKAPAKKPVAKKTETKKPVAK